MNTRQELGERPDFLAEEVVGESLDAVEASVVMLEDNPLFNAGRGSALTSLGHVEMDAAVMSSDARAGAGEIDELGLFDAFGDAICLVEWPDRLGDEAPAAALAIGLAADPALDDTRHITFNWSDPKWPARLQGLLDD